MSTIQEQLTALLNGVVAGGIYPMSAAQNDTFPYLVYQRVGSPIENTLSGNGNPPINNTRFQIDAWGRTYADAVNAAAAVRSAMAAWSVQNVQLHEHDEYESDMKAYRVIMDYSVWHY